MRSQHVVLAVMGAALGAALLASPAAMAQGKSGKGANADPRVACIRETEKTYPPRTLSRKVRDQYVEDCMAKRRAR